MIDTLEMETGPHPAASVIWLHVLGADGHDFAPIVPQLGLPESIPVRFIFPHAPSMPVTINNGYVMPAWYDVAHPDLTHGEDEAGIRASQREIILLIQHEKERGVPASRIVLAGFSQGGAMVLHTGLRFPERLAGIIALSTYLPLKAELEADAAAINRSLPIFMAHGTLDTVIPIRAGLASRDILQQHGCQVSWHEYAMAHTVCAAETTDIGRWLRQVLTSTAPEA
jgi:phospholipase/carboxylesterase